MTERTRSANQSSLEEVVVVKGAGEVVLTTAECNRSLEKDTEDDRRGVVDDNSGKESAIDSDHPSIIILNIGTRIFQVVELISQW